MASALGRGWKNTTAVAVIIPNKSIYKGLILSLLMAGMATR